MLFKVARHWHEMHMKQKAQHQESAQSNPTTMPPSVSQHQHCPSPIASLNQAVLSMSDNANTVENVDKIYLRNAHRLGLLAMDSIIIGAGESGRRKKLHYSKVISDLDT